MESWIDRDSYSAQSITNPEIAELVLSPCKLIENFDVELVDHSKRDTERVPRVSFYPLLVELLGWKY